MSISVPNRTMKILKLETDLLNVPLPRAVALPTAQDPRPATHVEVVIARVLTDSAHTGLGFAYILGGGGVAVRSILDTVIAETVVSRDPALLESLFVQTVTRLEGSGFAGLAARAYAAFDFALWDIKGKVAGVPVYQLLGGYRTKLKAIVSDTATPVLGNKQAIKDTLAALDAGAAGVQIEVGTDDPELDAERLRALREGIPDGAWFEVSACGRYDFASAAWMGTLGTEEFGLDGFGDPLRPDDLNNLNRLSNRLDVGLSVGAYFDRPAEFLRVIDQGGISAVRIDPLRIGGITPARKIAAAAELRHIAICPVRLPEIGTHLSAGVALGRMCETVDWFRPLFDGGPQYENGQLVVASGPGLGIRLNEMNAAKWRV